MGHYKSNVRDLESNLFEVLGVGEVLTGGAYDDLDVDTAKAILAEACRVAEGPYADSFADADRHPPTFDPETHEVTLPESLKQSLHAVFAGEWDRLGMGTEIGGTPAPRALYWAVPEMFLGANPAAHFYWLGTTMADIFHANATDEQKKWAVMAGTRKWGATMVLIEPDAGSDVGAAPAIITRGAPKPTAGYVTTGPIVS